MTRSVVHLLLVAASACVGSLVAVAQEVDTGKQANEPREEIETTVVTTEISKEAMAEIAELLIPYSRHNPDGEILSIVVVRGADNYDVTEEDIRLSFAELLSGVNPDHCYGKVDDLDHIVYDANPFITSVWCQSSNYEESPRWKRRLEWDYYKYNNPRRFHDEETRSLRCFKQNGDPNIGDLTQYAHSELCYDKR